jgi:FG-GAP-like repeat
MRGGVVVVLLGVCGAPWIAESTTLLPAGCDLNGDGKVDLIAIGADAIRLQLLDADVPVGPTGWVSTAGGAFMYAGCGDADGDGKDDLVFDSIGAGLTRVVLMDGTHPTGTTWLISNRAGHYPVAAIVDLNGDGRDDLVQQGDGGVRVNLLGPNGIGPGSYPSSSPDFRVAVAADVDGDGGANIVYESATHIRIDTTPRTYYPRPADSVLAGAGDFDNDGKADLVFTPSGALIWRMDGGVVTGVGTAGGAAFPIAFVADLQSDGRADLVGVNDVETVIRFDLMEGATTPGSTGWVANGAGIYHPRQLIDSSGAGHPSLVLEGPAFFAFQRFPIGVPGTRTYLGNGGGAFALPDDRLPLP